MLYEKEEQGVMWSLMRAYEFQSCTELCLKYELLGYLQESPFPPQKKSLKKEFWVFTGLGWMGGLWENIKEEGGVAVKRE